MLKIREAYEQSLHREGHVEDRAQLEVIARLEDLQQRIGAQPPRRSGLLALLKRDDGRDPVRGLYLWGGVGRGKTFLMDLFFDTLPISRKKRIHFHRMMHDVHARVKTLDRVEDPLDKVAADIARETRVLCFDEFFVSDIGDAMILGRLLEGLFKREVTLVATSNSKPDDLYKDGLQRQRFLPAIELLNRHTEVVNMDGGTDYRLRLLQKAGTYRYPDDAAATRQLEDFFNDSASTQIDEDVELDVNGRDIRAMRCAKGIVWFRFAGDRLRRAAIRQVAGRPGAPLHCPRRRILRPSRQADPVGGGRCRRAVRRHTPRVRIRTHDQSPDRNAVERLPRPAPPRVIN